MQLHSRHILRVPQIPMTVGLTDRDTGKVWYLKIDPSQIDPLGNPRFVLVDTVARWDRVYVYAAFDGPQLGRGVRLLMRGGRLGYEQVPGYNGVTAPVIVRGVSNDLLWYQLALPSSEQFTGSVPNDHLAYTLQTS